MLNRLRELWWDNAEVWMQAAASTAVRPHQLGKTKLMEFESFLPVVIKDFNEEGAPTSLTNEGHHGLQSRRLQNGFLTFALLADFLIASLGG